MATRRVSDPTTAPTIDRRVIGWKLDRDVEALTDPNNQELISNTKALLKERLKRQYARLELLDLEEAMQEIRSSLSRFLDLMTLEFDIRFGPRFSRSYYELDFDFEWSNIDDIKEQATCYLFYFEDVKEKYFTLVSEESELEESEVWMINEPYQHREDWYDNLTLPFQLSQWNHRFVNDIPSRTDVMRAWSVTLKICRMLWDVHTAYMDPLQEMWNYPNDGFWSDQRHGLRLLQNMLYEWYMYSGGLLARYYGVESIEALSNYGIIEDSSL